MTKLKPYQFTLLCTLLGIVVLLCFASVQHLVVVGTDLSIKNFVIPSIVGALVGFTFALFVQKLDQAKQAYKQDHELLKLVLDQVGIGIWDWYPKTDTVVFDERWCQLLGYKLHEIEPSLTSWQSRVHPEDLQACFADIKEHIEQKTPYYSNIHRMQHKDGHWVHILDLGRILERDTQGNPLRFTGTNQDISYLKNIEQQLEESNKQLLKISLIDGLTGLSNRHALDKHLQQAWAHWQRNHTEFALLMIDIDCFKEYNDAYGHIAGDECLKQVGAVLQTFCQRQTDMAARFGGEEFILIFDSTSLKQAHEISHNVCHAVEALQIEHRDSPIADHITISIGVSGSASQHEINNEIDIVCLADQALYSAKQQGRNRCAVSS